MSTTLRSHAFTNKQVRLNWKAIVQEDGKRMNKQRKTGCEEEDEKKKMRGGGGLFISLIMRDRSEAPVHSGMV